HQTNGGYMFNKSIAVFVMGLSVFSGGALAAEASPYAGEEARGIKALSESHIAGLLAGKGMGYAKAAEPSGYPGPAHVLELAKELSLTADQRTKTEAVFAQMEAAAKTLGAELVAAEASLDEALKGKAIDESSLLKLVQKIGDVESRLRTVHLNAHLQQVRVLDDDQVSKYMDLRGYHRGHHSKHGNHHQQHGH